MDSKPTRRGRKRIFTDLQRKERKRETAQKFAISRIYLGDQIIRWREFRRDRDLQCDADVAELLLDSYDSYQELIEYRKTSTPHTAAGLERLGVPLAFPEKKSSRMPRKRKSSIGPTRKYGWKKKPKEDDSALLQSSEALEDGCRGPSNLQRTDITRAPSNQKGTDMTRIPSNLQKTDTTRAFSNLQMTDTTRAPSNRQGTDMTRVPSNLQKTDTTRDPSNRQETDTTRVSNGPSEVLDHCYSAPYSVEGTDAYNISDDYYSVCAEDDYYSLCSVDDTEPCGDEYSIPIVFPVCDQVVEIETELSPMQLLGTEIMKNSFLEAKYAINFGFDYVQVIEMYNNSLDKVGVKLVVSINSSFEGSLFVHRQEVPKSHPCWEGMPISFSSAKSVESLMRRLDTLYSVCFGNPDEDIQNLTPVNSFISCGNSQDTIIAFREENFCASKGNVSYSSSIRSVNCTLLVTRNRCIPCQDVRRILKKRKLREERKKEHPITKNYVHNRTPHKAMDRGSLLAKLTQQREEIKTLKNEVDRLKRLCEREINNKGVKLL